MKSSGPGAAPLVNGNVPAALCYLALAISGLFFLTLEPYSRDKEIRFHAWQAILLGLGIFGCYTLSIVLALLLPWALVAILGALTAVTGLGLVVVWLALMYKAYVGERLKLPLIGPIAESKA